MIQSSVWNGAWTEGQLETERRLCVKMVERYHPALALLAFPAIEACSDPVRLEEWVLSAPDLDDQAYARLLNLNGRSER